LTWIKVDPWNDAKTGDSEAAGASGVSGYAVTESTRDMIDTNVAPRQDRAPPGVATGLPGVVPPRAQLPVIVPTRRPGAGRRWMRIAVMLAVACLGAGGGAWWWVHRQPPLPPGMASGNGRIEADPIDIDTKFAGRIAELRADEGDMVTAGQVVAVMDTRDLAASLKKSRAQAEQAQKAINEAHANLDQQRTQVLLAGQEIERTRTLVSQGWATKELLDQRQQTLDGANAGLSAAEARVHQAELALDAATHDVELYEVNIADNTLVAPRVGRIEYRIANVGEVLPAGGKVFTMLDIMYVYMDIYLPTPEAGRVKIGTDARIVLDAYPDHPIPAKVSFIARQAQFTPKMVETATERDKLMFRIRVRIDPERLRAHADAVRSGLPGMAYVRFDPNAAWPERLRGEP
jgi:HlyD family secretion protein